MAAKIFNALVLGIIFVLVLDFLLFVGLKINYFDHYGIQEYFNTIFADNQSLLLLIVAGFLFGYAMLYLRGSVIFDRIYLVLILLFASTFYPPIGRAVGEMLFAQKSQKLQVYDTNITADILYRGREAFYIKKSDQAKVVAIPENAVRYRVVRD